ncbi:nuclear pore complex protein Nup205 [Copidosoma floridanum]|uniref:nuclear pore complex protein Nup205 n=1 Tax=Copidosoma floridanum TaxID=29053 RepID=UPI0006C9457C|nr:nuclear pore complex protein Nup205 [Copidosoma floridanum]
MISDKGCTEDMWTPYKELQNLVECYITSTPRTSDPQYHEFMETLRIHRQNFLTLLKNPPKNTLSREEILKGDTDGITSPGLGHQLLTKELIDETLILSDMYNLNEFMALDLLYTAQLQMPHYPGLTRGLTAILLYYDGRKAITSTLKSLIQARAGHSWILDVPIILTKQITNYTNKLQEDGLLDRILQLLEEMDSTKEQDLLEQNRALGDAKHQFMVMKLFNDTRQDLADILYMWSAQSSLPSTAMFRLLALLQKKNPESEVGKSSSDKITLALIVAFLYSINFNHLNTRDDGEEIIKSMSLLSERGVFEEMLQKLLSPNVVWESFGLRGFAQFALAVAVTTIKSVPSLCPMQSITKEDEILVEAALCNKAFQFATEVLFKSKNLYYEEFYIRCFHSLISDFILLMPLKVKELRSRDDESMRLIHAYQQEGLEPPMNLDNHFKYFMLMIAELYANDPLNLNLAMDYWCQHSETSHISNSIYTRLPSRQVALFKFVRLASEILPAGLFVPYLKMIASLASSPQAARQAFNFLKPNGSSGLSTISWDHFFNSLSRYHYSLRQELPPMQDTVYRQRTHSKGITPSEVQGLEAVLQVVQVIANNDELSRIAFCEHPGWKVLQSIVGLVGCAMPNSFKGVLVHTLAALARSPESSRNIWENIEAAQLITTVPTTSNYSLRGVQTELEEIESRNEEYPLTRAMLQLLNVLTDFPLPRLLGLGQRSPGFDPYLHFVINSVLLRFDTRSYRNPAEKWQVANACLHILLKLANQYEPAPENLLGCKLEHQTGEMGVINAPPGYHIMTQLHSCSELLHTLLHILDKGCALLDTYDTFFGKQDLEAVTLSCLELLELGLRVQHQYMAQLSLLSSSVSQKVPTMAVTTTASSSTSSATVTIAATDMFTVTPSVATVNSSICRSNNRPLVAGLSRLLLGINPRSGKPDHMVNIAKYILYANSLCWHARIAVGVIQAVASEPGADAELLSTFTATPGLATNIRHGFVECLDTPENIIINNCTAAIEDHLQQQQQHCKDRILQLLMQSISRPSPNLAHYLLGFDIARGIKKTVIQQPGILGYPRTCLHSILGLLELSLQDGIRDRTTEACYCFLHSLLSNSKTSMPVLRFLRTVTNQDFVQRHLSKLPFQGSNQTSDLICTSWLLKIVAIELRVGSSSLQNALIQRLVGHPRQDRDKLMSPQKLLMDLLHYIDFKLQLESPTSWEYFDPAQVEMVLTRCYTPPALPSGPQLIDVKKLHLLIINELSETQGSSSTSQRKLMQQELQSVLKYALRKNQIRSLLYATVKFVEGWCQATEILFSIATQQQLTAVQRQNVLLNLTHDLLHKMTSCEALGEIKNLVSGTLLILLVNLRLSFELQSSDSVEFDQLKPSAPANTTMMKIILSQIIQWILNSEASSQKVRTHLLGALLYFLCIVGGSSSIEAMVPESRSFVSQLDNGNWTNRYIVPDDSSPRNDITNKCTISDNKILLSAAHGHPNRHVTIQVINSFGDKFIDVLCHSCSGGHDVCKMLALSCLNKILQLDSWCDNSWLIYLSSRGYLRHMIDGLLQSDKQLCCMLQSEPASVRPLYFYEAKMAMFCQLAATRLGAECLLENKILSCLASMNVIEQHPDVHEATGFGENEQADFLPSLACRYQQIFLPMLYLCDALLTTLGTDNQSCSVQICGFLQKHREIVDVILRNVSPSSSKLFLYQVACLTGVIARSATIDMYKLVDEESNKNSSNNYIYSISGAQEFRAYLYKLQRLMLNLLSKFQTTSRTDLNSPSSVQITANSMLYARNQAQHSQMGKKLRNVLFEPYVLQHSDSCKIKIQESSSGIHLGIIVEHLLSATRLLQNGLSQKKTHSVKEMNSADLKKHLTEEETGLDLVRQRIIVEQRLNHLEQEKLRNMKYASLIIEHSLYIIWSHLDFYAIQTVIQLKPYLPIMSLNENTLELKKVNESLPELKKGLSSVLTDNFTTKLLEMYTEFSTTEQCFVEALIRRIKRLLQFIVIK